MTTRTLLRASAGTLALALLVLWVLLLWYLFQEAGRQPAPAVVVMPILFFSLAIWALVAAIRDEPVYLLLAGGLSFFPIGLFLLFMPGFARWIGVVNLALAGIGIALLRLDGGAGVPPREEGPAPPNPV